MAEEYKDPMAELNAAADKVVAQQTEEVVEEIVEQEEQKEIVEQVEVDGVVAEESAAEEVVTETEEGTEVTEESETEEEITEPDLPISDWDVTPTETGEDAAEFDYKSLASEVGFEATGKEDFVQKINDMKAKAEVPDPLEKLPTKLKKAIEIASQDGNYMEYLQITDVDYNAYKNIDLVTNDYAQMLIDANGVVDEDRLNAVMDSMTDADIDRRGLELKQTLGQRQAQIAANIEADASRNREIATRELKSVLEGFNEYRGFKYGPTHKKQIFDGVSSGDMIGQMFHGSDGKIDQAKVVKAFANHLFGDKQHEFTKQQSATKATKKVLDKLSNKQIEPKGKLVGVKPTGGEKTIQQSLAEDVEKNGADAFKPRFN